jgi:hypothetical protein
MDSKENIMAIAIFQLVLTWVLLLGFAYETVVGRRG